ncbi:thiosulfate/3-mercaptopyruvate sulfurtransferase [Paenibacillus sp. 1_12]|uniref:sulfurtransferase n=1 Tax=Paenibacillus sp. 1_12 TaxID=1566278 RepID=UPI0008E8A9FA|nr:rhodanese-like domain-containing protein [Paenibacillus sp. 1_12]SFM18040.1 thiosulfate/3-mercaptopyruvate sulfurtransferase [Paenibacillus sp. 1_12]
MTTHNEFDYPNGHLLVDVPWVETNLGSTEVVLLDVRAKGYDAGHIPGAIRLDAKLFKDHSQPKFASADTVKRMLEQSGVSDGKTVVVYDEGGGVLATRVFYVLEYYGLKDQIKLLDGGYTAWSAAGNTISTELPLVSEGTLSVSVDNRRVVTQKNIQDGLDHSLLLDVRAWEEYTGADQRSNLKGGHIRGAIHKEWKEALGPKDENGVVRFKNYRSLQQEFEAAGLRPELTIVPYCQSNQRGAHTYFVLRLIGYSDVRPYEGSWDEWGNAEHTEAVT